jgi:hypothetical protein
MAALVATIWIRRRLLGTGLILASHTAHRRPERAPDDHQHPEASISLINSVEMTCQAIF